MRYEQRFGFTDNHRQIILAKVKKTSKIGQEQKNTSSCVNFERYCQKLIFGEENGHQSVSLPNFKIFFSLPNFLRF